MSDTSNSTFIGPQLPPKVEEKKYNPPQGKNLAKGFGKTTSQINKAINKVRVAINNFYYGKTNISNNKKLKNPLDYGLINLLNLLASIDLCNVISYSVNKLPGTKPFDPSEKPTTPLGKKKYDIQYAAYQIQFIIDSYYSDFGDANNTVSKTALSGIVSQLKQSLTLLISSPDSIFNDPEIKLAFPETSLMTNYLKNSLAGLDKYTNINSLENEQYKKIINYIDKTREVCVAVQSLNNPTNIIAFSDTFLGSNISDSLKKLDKVIDPKRITPVIKNIIATCQKLKSTVDQILGYIQVGRTIIFIATILIKIFKIISKFLSRMPIPSIFGTISVHVITARANEKMQYWADYFLKRLSEINSVLNNIYYLAQDVSIKIGNLIEVIKLIILNLENCDQNIDPSIVPSLQALITDLQKSKDSLDKFIINYDNNKKKTDSIYGNYTIQILTEELTDEGISLKRRYGIALDSNGIAVVESTPTFASDDQIIIQEVKLLLESKKLVTANISALNANELSILEESLNYLDSEDIDQQTSLDTLDSVSFNMGLDDPENENDEQEDSLNLNAFVSKLKGGKRLRRRMRKLLAKSKFQLVKDLQNSDPTGKFSNGIVKRQKIAALNDAIKAETELIRALTEEIAILVPLAITQPALRIVILKKKKQIEDSKNKIKDLNTQLSQIK